MLSGADPQSIYNHKEIVDNLFLEGFELCTLLVSYSDSLMEKVRVGGVHIALNTSLALLLRLTLRSCVLKVNRYQPH